MDPAVILAIMIAAFVILVIIFLRLDKKPLEAAAEEAASKHAQEARKPDSSTVNPKPKLGHPNPAQSAGKGFTQKPLVNIAPPTVVTTSDSKKAVARAAQNNQSDTAPMKKASPMSSLPSWLLSKWEDVDAGRLEQPDWYYDPATDRQFEKLDSFGVKPTKLSLSKGQMSDVIGLFIKAGSDTFGMEVLKFFKVKTSNLSETYVRFKAQQLLNDPAKKAEWEARPPKPQDLEFFRFFRLDVPKGKSKKEVISIVSGHLTDWLSSDDERAGVWRSYDSILDTFADKDERDMYCIKKPSVKLIRDSVHELMAEGCKIEDLDGDPELVVGRLLQKKPDLLDVS